LQQLFLTDGEALSTVENACSVIPQNLVHEKATEKTRREIIQDLLSNEPRSETNKSGLWGKKKEIEKRTSTKMLGL